MPNLRQKNNLDRCKTVACRRCDRQTDKQTDKRTNGTDQYTLRKVEDFRKVTNKQTDMGITIPRPPPMGGEVINVTDDIFV